MAELPNSCPSCGSSLHVTQLACSSCSVHLDGQFPLPPLLTLPAADLRFVCEFVVASGSLKEMARLHGQSYPTIRNRLNDIIAHLTRAPDDVERRRGEILDAIAGGRMSVQEAARLLRELEK